MTYIISSGVTSDSLNITNSDSLIITDGGRVNNTTVDPGCGLFISSGGTANISFINDAKLHVSRGGLASQTQLNGTEEHGTVMQVEDGGYADVILVNAYTVLNVYSGGTATDIVWTPCVGHLSIEDGAEVEIFSQYKGVYYGTGSSLLSSALTMDSKTLATDEEMYVFSGGVASRTVVGNRGTVRVSGGGTVDSTTIYAGSMFVHSGGVAANTVNYGGTVEVSSGGVINSTAVLEKGLLKVCSGGIAYNPVATNSVIDVYSGGALNGFTIRDEGSLYAATEAKLTGRMILSDEAYVYVEHNAIIDFNISSLTPGAAVRINNFQLVDGWWSADYTITISETQANGTYMLAIGFPSLEQAISVVDTSGEVLTTLSVGETKDIDGTECTLKIEDDTLIFRKGKDEELPYRPAVADDGRNNWLYDKKTKTLNDDLANSTPAVIGPEAADVRPDAADEISYEENETVFHNYVGAEDEFDYVKIRLEKGARLSFSLISTDAAKFFLYSLIPGKVTKGVQTYTQKSLQSTSLKKTKEGGMYYTAQTAPILLAAGEYYVAMQSTNAKSGNAYYSVEIERDASVFFTRSDNGDDWTDLKTKGANGEVGDAGTLDAGTPIVIEDEWVGFGDAVDYKKIAIGSAAKLSFAVEAGAAVKFTVWSLAGKTDKKGVTTWSLKSLQSLKLSKADETGRFKATAATLFLKDPGAYYISVESTNAAKGDSADYSVALDKAGTLFFTDADDQVNNWIYDKKAKTPNPDDDSFALTEITTATNEVLLDAEGSVAYEDAAGTVWRNFVGYGDTADYAVIKLASAASPVFQVSATDASKFTIWSLTSTTDKKGTVKYTLKSLQSTTLKKAKGAAYYEATTKSLSLAAGSYYISMESTNAAKGGAAYYNVTLDTGKSKDLPAVQDASVLSGFGLEGIADPSGALTVQDGFGLLASGLADLPDSDLAPQVFANLA